MKVSELRSGNKVVCEDGKSRLVIKKSTTKSVFKDVYPWTVVLGEVETSEVVKVECKENGVRFKDSELNIVRKVG